MTEEEQRDRRQLAFEADRAAGALIAAFTWFNRGRSDSGWIWRLLSEGESGATLASIARVLADLALHIKITVRPRTTTDTYLFEVQRAQDASEEERIAELEREVARLRALLRYAYEHVEPHELHPEVDAVDCASCRTIEAELGYDPDRTLAELLALRDALTREYEITAAREESVSRRPGWTRPDSPLERAMHVALHLEEHAPPEQRDWAERELRDLRRLIDEATR